MGNDSKPKGERPAHAAALAVSGRTAKVSVSVTRNLANRDLFSDEMRKLVENQNRLLDQQAEVARNLDLYLVREGKRRRRKKAKNRR